MASWIYFETLMSKSRWLYDWKQGTIDRVDDVVMDMECNAAMFDE